MQRILPVVAGLVVWSASDVWAQDAPPHGGSTPSEPASQPSPGTEPAVAEPNEAPPAERLTFQIPREADGEWNIDARVVFEHTPWELSGVEIDNRRIHPVTQRAPLDDAQRAWLREAVEALRAMPSCEPLARAPGERTFRLVLDGVTYEDPALWFRDAPMDATDPCLAPARLAQGIRRIWNEAARARR